MGGFSIWYSCNVLSVFSLLFYFHNMEHLFHVNKCISDNDLDAYVHLVP